MKQKVLFSLLILMLMSISVSAQTGGGRIAGVVIDNTDEDPLPTLRYSLRAGGT